jgi:hypothetical protein
MLLFQLGYLSLQKNHIELPKEAQLLKIVQSGHPGYFNLGPYLGSLVVDTTNITVILSV